MNQQRDKAIDVLKAIGIIMMVYGHCGLPGTHFIYLFHMAIFFIVTGFLFDDRKFNSFDSWKRYIIKKFKKLYIPYVVINGGGTALNNIFIKINIYTDNPGIRNYVPDNQITTYMTPKQMVNELAHVLVFRGGTQLGDATWFLATMFESLFCYSLVALLLYKKSERVRASVNLIISVLLLCASYVLGIKGITLYRYQLIGYVYILFFIGQYGKKALQRLKPIWIFICFVILLVLNQFGSIEISKSIMTNPMYYVVCSIAGFVMIYGVSKYITDIRGLSVIGQHTLAIMILHFAAFKVITLIEIAYYGLPLYVLAAFPTYQGNTIWGIGYCIVGVIIPVMLAIFWGRFKNAYRCRISNI